jgi:hypothetical protein
MTTPTVKLVKATRGMKAAKRAAAGAVPVAYTILDTQDGSFTIQGTDSAGDVIDISTVATLTVTSSDPTAVSVDPPVGMKFAVHALKATVVGTPLVLTITATWNDGSIGPFTISQPVDVTAGGVSGLLITPGTPTIR